MNCLPELERNRFFEKKRRKKLLFYDSREVQTPMVQIKKSLFDSFSSEKEALATLP
jgi:hypothetical protein